MRSGQREGLPWPKRTPNEMATLPPPSGRGSVAPLKVSFRRPLVVRYAVCIVVVVTALVVVTAGVLGVLFGRAYWVSDKDSHRSKKTNCDNLDDDRPNLITCQILNAELVIYGRVLRQYGDEERYGKQGYTAEMEVFCTLKGGQVASRVNVTHAGYIMGQEFSTELEPPKKYLIIVEPLNRQHEYRPTELEIVAHDNNVNSALRACHLDVRYPIGVDPESAEVKCPTGVPSSDCLSEHDFTTTTATATPTVPTTSDCNEDEEYCLEDIEEIDDVEEYNEYERLVSASCRTQVVVETLTATTLVALVFVGLQ